MRREYETLYKVALRQVRSAAERMGVVLPAVGPPEHQLAPVLERYLWQCGVMAKIDYIRADVKGESGREYPRLTLSIADVSPLTREAMERLTAGVPEDGPVEALMNDVQEAFKANRTRVYFRATQPLEVQKGGS